MRSSNDSTSGCSVEATTAAAGSVPAVERPHRESSSEVASRLPLVAGVIWGTAFPAITLALDGFSPFAVSLWRAVIGAASLGLVLWLRGARPRRLDRGAWVRLFVISLAGAGIFWPTQAVAVRLSNPVNVAFLVSSYPAVVAVAAPYLVGERARRVQFAGLGLALVGSYLVIGRGEFLSVFSGGTFGGDTLALVASLCFAAYILLGRRWQPRLALSPEALTLSTFSLSLPVLAITALVAGPLVSGPSVTALVALGWLGIGASTGAFLALNAGLKVGKVSRSSIHLMIIPPVAALAAWLVLGSTMSPIQWVGGALVLLGVLLSSR